MERFYVNRETGEVSESHSIAMGWYRAGHQVEVWENGKMVLALMM